MLHFLLKQDVCEGHDTVRGEPIGYQEYHTGREARCAVAVEIVSKDSGALDLILEYGEGGLI